MEILIGTIFGLAIGSMSAWAITSLHYKDRYLRWIDRPGRSIDILVQENFNLSEENDALIEDKINSEFLLHSGK